MLNNNKLKILIVEDNEIIHILLKDFLVNITNEIYFAVNGKEGLESFKKNNPDIIITDIGMPIMDGLSMSDEIRKINPKIPIVVMTSYQEPDILIKAIEVGINYYLLKPIKKDAFLSTIEKAYEKVQLENKLLQAEKELKEINQHLEERIIERTNELNLSLKKLEEEIQQRIQTEEALRTAKQIAENANKTKDLFLANMSHELRTPLNGIFGMINLLNKTNLDNKQREFLEYIKISANGLHKIINDILDISKIEAGKLTIFNSVFNLWDTLKFIINTRSFLSFEQNVDIEFQHENLPQYVFGDEERLKQVINNLLSNAAKFSNNKKIVLSAKVNSYINGDVELLFSVKDQGIGIDKENIPRLFSAFSQVDYSFTRKYGGTGLGLAISKQLVEMMGGKIWVESEKGKGSTFYFTVRFGVVEKRLAEADDKSQKDSAIDEKQLKYDNINILVAEDNYVNLKIIQEFLSSNGFRVAIAENGEKVLDLIKNNFFDIILMDIQLPDHSGLELTSIIREQQKDSNQRSVIIAVTAFASRNECDQFIEQGMDAYITKPIDFEYLLKMLNSYCEKIQKGEEVAKFNVEQISKSIYDYEPVDLSYLNRIFKGNQNTIKMFVKYILDTYPEELNKMKSLIDEQDYDALHRLTHKMRAGISNFRAYRFLNLLDNIQSFCVSKDINSIQNIFSELTTEFEKITDYLLNLKYE